MSWNREYRTPKIYEYLGRAIPILVVIMILSYSPLVFGLVTLLVFLIGVSSYYLKYAYKNTVIPNETEIVRMFPEESGNITIPIENRGKLPILNGELAFFLYDPDKALEVIDKEPDHQSFYQYSLSISPLTKKRQRTDFKALKRGVAQIRTIEYTVFDLLKLSSLRLNYNGYFRGEILVFPTLKTVYGMEQIVQQKQGDLPKQHALHEDVLMTMGTREYVSEDPFNRIHWKASARTNHLQTKVYEKTTVLKWSLVINVRHQERGQVTIEALEEVLSQAAFICHYATTHHITFELFINIRVPKLLSIHLQPGLGKDHLNKALELLARVSKNALTTLPNELLKVVELKTGHQPFIIHLGEYSSVEEKIYRSWKLKGATVYRVETNEESGRIVSLEGAKK